MDNSSIEDTLDVILAEFRTEVENPETGLDVEDPALLQLRKACRLLEAVNSLREQNGYYTVVIEAPETWRVSGSQEIFDFRAYFSAIERTLQFYLQEKGYIREDDFVDHRKVYELGENAALYGPDFREKLVELWENNRSRTYYREGFGTERSAELMADLAQQIHSHVLQLAGHSHDCICNTA